MRLAIALLLSITLAACDDGGPCAPRDGLYRYSLTPLGVTSCPPFPATVLNINPAQRGLPNDCGGSIMDSDDMCTTVADFVCKDPDGSAVISRGKLTWASDGGGGSGTISLEIRAPDGRLACSGAYTATYTRL